MRLLARFWPWPFSFDPMAGIDTSQPMSKITLRRMLPLEQRYYTKNRSDWSGENSNCGNSKGTTE